MMSKAKVCIHGHKLSRSNTYFYEQSDGWVRRKCKACRRATNRLWRARVRTAATERESSDGNTKAGE